MNSSLWLACWIPSHLSSVEDVAGSSSGVGVLSENASKSLTLGTAFVSRVLGSICQALMLREKVSMKAQSSL